MSYPVYGRYAAPEPPSMLTCLHTYDGVAPTTSDHEPKVGVLDQSDLIAQGIRCSTFIPGAKDVDALGSCTANATTAHLSSILDQPTFDKFVYGSTTYSTTPGVYADVVGAEKGAIRFYYEETHQTGDPSQEWPPTDCGSSGPFIFSEAQRLGYIRSQRICDLSAESFCSLLQIDSVLMGSPWFYSWEQPDAQGFVDGGGTAQDLQDAINSGVAGGHETCPCAIEKIAFQSGSRQIDPFNTIIRDRNSWGKAWGDNGECRFHLSTLLMLGGNIDVRQLVK